MARYHVNRRRWSDGPRAHRRRRAFGWSGTAHPCCRESMDQQRARAGGRPRQGLEVAVRVMVPPRSCLGGNGREPMLGPLPLFDTGGGGGATPHRLPRWRFRRGLQPDRARAARALGWAARAQQREGYDHCFELKLAHRCASCPPRAAAWPRRRRRRAISRRSPNSREGGARWTVGTGGRVLNAPLRLPTEARPVCVALGGHRRQRRQGLAAWARPLIEGRGSSRRHPRGRVPGQNTVLPAARRRRSRQRGKCRRTWPREGTALVDAGPAPGPAWRRLPQAQKGPPRRPRAGVGSFSTLRRATRPAPRPWVIAAGTPRRLAGRGRG